MENTYVRVVGSARSQDVKPFIVAFTVEPITNPNDIATHFLEVIADSLILEKRMNSSLNKFSTSMDTGDDVNQFTTTQNSGFSEVQRSVLNVISKYGKESTCGLKREEIKSHLRAIGASVDEAITFLANEGHIFSTNDENTFKSTDC